MNFVNVFALDIEMLNITFLIILINRRSSLEEENKHFLDDLLLV